MMAFGLLALLVILGIAYASSRRLSEQDATHPTALARTRAEGLQRWVEAGLINEAQAEKIDAFEDARRAARPAPRVSPTIEALAYVGGILLAVGAGMLVGQYWDALGVGGRIGILAAAAGVAGLVGAMVGERDAVTWRLRGFLWALSTAGVVAATALFAHEVLNLSGEPVALMAAGAGTVEAACGWWLRDRPLQHMLTFVGLAVSIGVAIAWAGGEGGLIGFALWLFGAGWAWLAWRERVPPAVVGFPLGALLTLVACGIVSAQVEWLAPLLGLATAAAWIGIGVAANESLMLAPGVAGVFVFLPWTLGYYFGGTLGAPAVAMASGAALLVVVALLVRRRNRSGTAGGAARSRHFHRVAHP
jgi:uncharacterized membrane protein